jgi:hypothetical protein
MKIKSKGTRLQAQIAGVFTDVPQLLSIELPEAETETFEADTLDNTSSGIPYEVTGRTEGGKASGELFLDPESAVHRFLTSLLKTPAKVNWKLIFANVAATAWPFSGAGFSLGATIAVKDGVKSKFGIKLDGIPTYPA